jgi:hypothetical protein
MVDVVPALLNFELNAAGVMIIREGEANCDDSPRLPRQGLLERHGRVVPRR